MNISPYFYGSYANHEAKRLRKLLLTKREIKRLEEEAKTLATQLCLRSSLSMAMVGLKWI